MTLSSTTLVALTGRKGAGKDTLGQVLLDRGFVNAKFAGGLKQMLSSLLAYQGVDDHTINRMIEGDLKEVETPLLQGKTPRHAMQTLGNEWGRKLIGESLWVDALAKRLDTLDRALITDCRYPNELDFVRARGGKTVRIGDSGSNNTDGHESEAYIDELEVDAEFINDKNKGVDACRAEFADFIDRTGNA